MSVYTSVFERLQPSPIAGGQAAARLAPRPGDATRASHGERYLPAIDGLRAIAILAVLLYHAGVAALPGGFVGVDVFFVISGYLITATSLPAWRQGRFSISGFYERRVRRIMPALTGMVLGTALLAALLLPPAALVPFGRDLLGTAGFAGNLVFCFTSDAPGGYFAVVEEPSWLLHGWSLAIEEQFYLLFPFSLLLLRGQSEDAIRRRFAVAALASFGLACWLVRSWPEGAFYLVLPRAWELLIGSLLALGLVPVHGRRSIREAAASVGVSLILIAVLTFNGQTAFPGAAALLPCLGAWLVIYAVLGGSTCVGRVLASPPLRAIGLISYSLYLWHWPVTVAVRRLSTGKLHAPQTVYIFGLSLLAAALSCRFVERPFRGRSGWLSRRQLFAAGGVAIGAMASAGLLLIGSAGWPQRFGPKTLALIAANEARAADEPTDECSNWMRTASDLTFCRVGPLAPRNILFWGDSLVNGLRPAASLIARRHGFGDRGIVFGVASGCVPAPGLARNVPGYHCLAVARRILQRAEEPDVATVYIGFSTWFMTLDGALCPAAGDGGCARPLSRREALAAVLASLRQSVEALRREGKQVVLSLPQPGYDLPIPQYEINRAILGRGYAALQRLGLARRLRRDDDDAMRAGITQLAASTGATLFDPVASLCHGAVCPIERDGVSLYRDSIHVAYSQGTLFADGLQAALR